MAEHLGTEVEFEVEGKRWRLARWDRAIWKKYLEYAKGELPDVLAQVERRVLKLTADELRLQRELAALQGAADPANPLAGANDPRSEELSLQIEAIRLLADRLVSKALAEAGAHISLGSPKVSALTGSPEGSIQLLYLLLQKYHAGITEQEAMDLAMAMGQEKLQEQFARASGNPGNPSALPVAA